MYYVRFLFPKVFGVFFPIIYLNFKTLIHSLSAISKGLIFILSRVSHHQTEQEILWQKHAISEMFFCFFFFSVGRSFSNQTS